MIRAAAFSLSAALVTVGCAGSPENAFEPGADQFGLQQFKIVYALEGQETGTRTMWVEDYGARVAIEDDLTAYGARQHRLSYWDGENSHMRTLPDGAVTTLAVRTKVSEPTSFATSSARDLEIVGYTALGEKTLVGKTCEHWRNAQLNFEGCRWNNIELEFLNGAGTNSILQRTTATELVAGEGIPEHIRMLGGG